MVRPATRSGDIVSVNINGKSAAWIDGAFFGDPDIVAHARLVSESMLPVEFYGAVVTASLDTADGAFAAMYSYNPDQTVLVEAPLSTSLLASGSAAPEQD